MVRSPTQTGQFLGNFILFDPFGFSTCFIQIQITRHRFYKGFDLGTRKVGCPGSLLLLYWENWAQVWVTLGCPGICHFWSNITAWSLPPLLLLLFNSVCVCVCVCVCVEQWVRIWSLPEISVASRPRQWFLKSQGDFLKESARACQLKKKKKKMHIPKAENSVWFHRQTEDLSPGDRLSDGSSGKTAPKR